MDVKLDEYLVLTRASHIYGILKDKNLKYLDGNDSEKYLKDTSFIIPDYQSKESYVPKADRLNITKNIKFCLEALVPGLELRSYVLCRDDNSMENIFIASFPHTRKDNGEIVDIKMGVIITNTSVLAITPFNAPDLTERFSSPNQYIIGLMEVADLNCEYSNKGNLLNYIETKKGEKTRGECILDKLDAIATSIHMQCEGFLKVHSNITELGFNAITSTSPEFEHIYGKYKDSLNPEIDDIIPIQDFLPIIVTEDDVNKTLCRNSVASNAGVESKIKAYEHYEDLTTAEPNTIKEVLIRCPERTVPVAVKLLPYIYYTDYNTILIQNESGEKEAQLIDPRCPIVTFKEYDTVGTEGMMDVLNPFQLLRSLKQFGISSGTKIYELLKPIVKLPKDMAMTVVKTVKSVFTASSKIEKEESEEIKEQMLNDELDVVMTKFDIIVKNTILFVALTFMLTSIFFGLIAWLLARNYIKETKVKGIERVERRLISTIQRYDTKIQYANQESDYESVDSLTHKRDTYKMMLDKLREVKREALGKEEKYTDTYKEYSQD